VAGIVASKMTEKFHKPTILVCFEGEKGKGSGRSVPGLDLHEILVKLKKDLDKYGGHEMAVGLEISKSNFERFKENFEKAVSEKNIQELTPIIKLDSDIKFKDITKEDVKQLEVLEPFGEQNKAPIFSYQNLKIDSIRALTEGKHLKLLLKDESYEINAIGFNMGEYAEEYLIGDKVNIIGKLEINRYNGEEIIQFNLIDIMKSI